jgi:hypothetical protein
MRMTELAITALAYAILTSWTRELIADCRLVTDC